MAEALLVTDLSLPNRRQGKVRDIYDLQLPDGDDGVLIVATDRVSVFDVVLQGGIPDKGRLLTQLSCFWFEFFGDIDHHLVSTDVADVPGLTDLEAAQLDGRIMICRKSEVIPVECIVRGYLAGSGYKDYLNTGAVCGLELPAGLENGSRLPEPLFTPSTKAAEGHDENISYEEAEKVAGSEVMSQVREIAMKVYRLGRDHAETCGIIIADTKMEFGVSKSGNLLLIDEVLTPDSSRFWPASEWQPGSEQQSYDKQYVRNYTETLVAKGEWNKEYPGPSLPQEVIDNTLQRYLEAIRRLTGSEF